MIKKILVFLAIISVVVLIGKSLYQMNYEKQLDNKKQLYTQLDTLLIGENHDKWKLIIDNCTNLGNYLDADLYKSYAESNIELEKGLSLSFDNNVWDVIINKFYTLDDFKDSKSLYYYSVGCKHLGNSEFKEAISKFENSLNIRDADILKNYAESKLIFDNKSLSDLDRFTQAKEKLNFDVSNISPLFYMSAVVLKNKVNDLYNKEKTYQKSLESLDSGDFALAFALFGKLSDNSGEGITFYKDTKDKYYLAWGLSSYMDWVKEKKPSDSYNRGTAAFELARINIYNCGKYNDLVKKAVKELGKTYTDAVASQKTNEKFSEKFSEKDSEKDENSKFKSGNPPIGCTKNEALTYYDWRNPEDINTTTTKYGVSEQYCYSGSRYLYFDDGILSVIQD